MFRATDVVITLVVADINNDGHNDMAYTIGDQLMIFPGDSSGELKGEITANTVFVRAMVVADTNQDEHVDFAVVDVADGYTATLTTLIGDGGFEFDVDEVIDLRLAGDYDTDAWWLVPAKLDSDDELDFIVATPEGVYALLGGTGEFLGFRETALGGIALGKLDSDGDVDLVYTRDGSATRTPGLVTALNDGTGYFGTRISPATAVSGPGALAAADFDGDSSLDVAYIVADGRIATQLGTGAGAFSSIEWLDTLQSPAGLVAIDLNADGVPDLVVGYADERVVSIFPGTGDGGFGARQDHPAAIAVDRLAVGDFNGDEVPDIFGFDTDPSLGDILVLLSTP